VILTAQRLRSLHPGRYGTKGSRKGDLGHVANGWRRAMRDAAKLRRQELVLLPPAQQIASGELRERKREHEPRASPASVETVAVIRSSPLSRPSLPIGDETTAVEHGQHDEPMVGVKEEDSTLVW